jgi:hypothetical protein
VKRKVRRKVEPIMSVPDTTTCPICYGIVNRDFMARHAEFHEDSGDIVIPEID